MRITITQGPFLPVPPLLGGAVEKVWFALGKEFARRGHDVTHVSRAHPSLPRREIIDGVRHLRVSGFTATPSPARRMPRDLWYGLRVLPHLPPADILVTNSFWLPVLARARRSRGLVYAHVARYPRGQLKLYRRTILQTVSEPIRQAILAEDASAAARTRVIPYPLSAGYFAPSPAPGAANTLLYAGRVHPEKGIRLLIDAFARLPEALRASWRLRIIGPWETACGGGGEQHIGELRSAAAPVADRVEFTGRIFDEAALIAHYRAARVFVYPSLAERGETFGLAALEAMASGCAPVVSSLACFRDFIRPGENGLVFDHRGSDPAAALASALGAFLADDVSINKLRRSAWQSSRAYTLEKIATRFLDDFAMLAGGPGLRPAKPDAGLISAQQESAAP
ncbi:glycosyltransferase family 4 protein [Termitidicoccus mucosus]|uniref:Glycosyl transferase family 1 domain-containing protein n=1 Tax=Termitidicoccus mucosus TaxID=1184151 RepID=A0A178IPL3_9BACT|nr:hypothetical protein AW736_03860 [Opitutaceae bacterium TSB47]